MTSPTAITDRAADLEAIADQIRHDAIYADGPAYTQDMDRAARMDSEAAAIRRAALPLEVRCRPVLLVPVRSESHWSHTYRVSIERALEAGDTAGAETLRRMRANHSRYNAHLYVERVTWRAA